MAAAAWGDEGRRARSVFAALREAPGSSSCSHARTGLRVRLHGRRRVECIGVGVGTGVTMREWPSEGDWLCLESMKLTAWNRVIEIASGRDAARDVARDYVRAHKSECERLISWEGEHARQHAD
eukprot:6188215-Pleurochrysis_carterae.AAC.1